MSTIELREKIISQLANINDTSFLRAIKVLIDTKVEKEVYRLSDYQKERIRLGRDQLKKGQTISHDEVQKEINQWLGSK
jgi:predicted transcriptional regulator